MFLAGGRDKRRAAEQLALAVGELTRLVRKGGIVLSLSAPATTRIIRAFNECKEGGQPAWRTLLNEGEGGFITEEGMVEGASSLTPNHSDDTHHHHTSSGFASTNVDAAICAWERL